ncbi:hypothetical protein DASC09_042960 [Saccharomycopsis crataegensis]|uniref:Uncharacterized protein n=1 Tax=Saccharomycopsis crataegensis TaxID=43959 RepID=A0AAV5QQG7_9ASCO|nr:hypothetical protein DASC09_042960 [Saccharomycopsis crataegensis]
MENIFVEKSNLPVSVSPFYTHKLDRQFAPRNFSESGTFWKNPIDFSSNRAKHARRDQKQMAIRQVDEDE